MPLTDQQREWAHRYARSRSTVDAGKPLGVSPAQGRAWLADPEVEREIADAQDERNAHHPQSEDLIEEWWDLARVDILQDFVVGEGIVRLSEHASAAAGRCVKKIKIKANGDTEIELRDRDEMLRHLAEYRGLTVPATQPAAQAQEIRVRFTNGASDARDEAGRDDIGGTDPGGTTAGG